MVALQEAIADSSRGRAGAFRLWIWSTLRIVLRWALVREPPRGEQRPSDLRTRHPLCRQQDDPGPLHVLVVLGPIPDNRLETSPILCRHDGTNIVSHARGAAHLHFNVNPIIASVL